MLNETHTEITWLGHATLYLVSPRGKRILVDPWFEGNPSLPADFHGVADLGPIDYILLTHIHGDHAGGILETMRANPSARCVCIYEAANWLTAKGAASVLPMNKGGSRKLDGITVTMTNAFHSSSFIEADGRTVYGGEACGYVVHMEDGYTIYISGDTCLFGDMALIREMDAPNLAILPIGDVFTMGPRQAARAVKLLGVTDVFPTHYASLDPLTGTIEEFKREMAELPSVRVRAPAPGVALHLS